MRTMPIVELVAKRTLMQHPEMGLGVVDLIVLLWMYSNPYSNHRRQLSSMKNVLRMTETLQKPGGGLDITDDELTQLVLASLRRLKEKGLVQIWSQGRYYVRGVLTERGIDLVRRSITTPALKRVTAEFGNNP